MSCHPYSKVIVTSKGEGSHNGLTLWVEDDKYVYHLLPDTITWNKFNVYDTAYIHKETYELLETN